MDFCTKYAIASTFSGYWVCLPGVEGGQSFVPLFASVFLLALADMRLTGGSGAACQAQLSLPGSAATPGTDFGWAGWSVASVPGDGIVLQWWGLIPRVGSPGDSRCSLTYSIYLQSYLHSCRGVILLSCVKVFWVINWLTSLSYSFNSCFPNYS